jgi:hypothetical protein
MQFNSIKNTTSQLDRKDPIKEGCRQTLYPLPGLSYKPQLNGKGDNLGLPLLPIKGLFPVVGTAIT